MVLDVALQLLFTIIAAETAQACSIPTLRNFTIFDESLSVKRSKGKKARNRGPPMQGSVQDPGKF